MKIFIELPTWLGDAVMASAAIEMLSKNYEKAELTFFGSFAACELYKIHPKCEKIIIDESKKSGQRWKNLKKIAQEAGTFTLALSFRSSFASKVLFFFLRAKKKFIFKKSKKKQHQVLKYVNFLEQTLKIKAENPTLKLYFPAKNFSKPSFGINAGASFGSAKRWEARKFAEVALHFADSFDILLFGGKNEEDICEEIEKIIKKNGKECKNLCGKTSIKELCENIAGLQLFLTNDSGPMHIAAAYKVNTIAIFGPTKFDETSPFKNENAYIIHKNFPCQPCMKRVCPIKSHICMKAIQSEEVIFLIEKNFLSLNFKARQNERKFILN